MANDRLDEVWLGRIGPGAPQELRRSGRLLAAFVPVMLIAAIGASVELSSGSSGGTAIGVVCVVVAVAAFVAWVSSRMRWAAARSAWFGVTIGGLEIPKMRSADFDAWCGRRGLAPGDRAAH